MRLQEMDYIGRDTKKSKTKERHQKGMGENGELEVFDRENSQKIEIINKYNSIALKNCS